MFDVFQKNLSTLTADTSYKHFENACKEMAKHIKLKEQSEFIQKKIDEIKCALRYQKSAIARKAVNVVSGRKKLM